MTHVQRISTRTGHRNTAILPIVCGLLVILIGWHYETEEPFGGFVLRDALMEIGGPILLVSLWVRWFWVARSRHSATVVWIVGAGWCLLTLWAAGYYVLSYCRQPWAWYVPHI